MSGKITRKRGRTSAGRGLVVAALRGLTQAGFSELEIKKYVIPQRTRRNRADKNQTLTVEESDRAVRILRVQTLAEVSFADKEKATVETFLKTTEMPWAHWWAGGEGDELRAALHIRSYPTIFVLDGRGVIRYKGVRGKKMDEAVDALLAELAADDKPPR